MILETCTVHPTPDGPVTALLSSTAAGSQPPSIYYEMNAVESSLLTSGKSMPMVQRVTQREDFSC